MSLEFHLLSGGSITIHTPECPSCESKACVKVCAEQSPGPVLILGEDGRPCLKPTLTEIKRGVCTECLGCLLECGIHGNNVVRFQAPLEGLEAYLAEQEAAGRIPIYRQDAKQVEST
ncbi:MAG: hypothetical protein HY713_14780 [candidate division NC10 bacterium]|nr:hypothetical protein [candidate division NC10 bacterium]